MKHYVQYESDISCHMCGHFHKTLKIIGTGGGIFYENPNRYNFVGVCRKCDKTIISYHKTMVTNGVE